MPDNKIISVGIFCLALVVSVWLYNREPSVSSVVSSIGTTTSANVEPRPYIETKSNDDWKKTLIKMDNSNPAFDNLTTKKEDSFDATSATGQLGQEIVSQYLAAKQGGKDLTQADIDKIVNNIANTPQYTSITAPVYTIKNIKVIENPTQDNLRAYKNKIISSLNKSKQVKGDPLKTFVDSMKKEDENVLKELDPTIILGKSFIKDLLEMDVPKNAIALHLNLLNASSKATTDLEIMRSGIVDPVKALPVIGYYVKDMVSLVNAMNTISGFIMKF